MACCVLDFGRFFDGSPEVDGLVEALLIGVLEPLGEVQWVGGNGGAVFGNPEGLPGGDVFADDGFDSGWALFMSIHMLGSWKKTARC
ncbi:hypothetical protein UFOVP296_6 [uncultured Caudovirales phage]|uniref:Uncharacterized protein n=1 Tax=uncultured Caudovirales phage TaxID=2100421 RepID=A0A6J5LNU9_9CAUD|nr:hypothetical protein UFOVP296_6 [uncultured Caudovirales phage]CAB4169986.1 hypothetical protein UFOVP912_25 [uncultured Caudovirales phage]CAB4199086.1 hypothetical protein UFOVP1334_13 [uncultured Caudovirales phage]